MTKFELFSLELTKDEEENVIHSFFIRTKFIRTLSLNFGEILRTFLMLKLTRFLIVLKLKY